MDEVMVGALDATAMELDRVANQMPERADFWDRRNQKGGVLGTPERGAPKPSRPSLSHSPIFRTRGSSPSCGFGVAWGGSLSHLRMVVCNML